MRARGTCAIKASNDLPSLTLLPPIAWGRVLSDWQDEEERQQTLQLKKKILKEQDEYETIFTEDGGGQQGPYGGSAR